MRTSSRASLHAHALVKRYGQVTAVDQLSFRVHSGMVTGFLGPNGAGKSTTMRMLLGLDRPTSGTAHVDGRPLAKHPHPMRVVGAMLDARAVHPRRSAADHLTSIALAGGVSRRRVPEVLDIVGLARDGHRMAGDYSLGMKQRLGIATALMGDPRILIFDEPLNGLDPEGIRWARSLMRELAAQGRTVLFSSHLMGEMELAADHLIVIHHGKLLSDQSLQDFIAAHTRHHVRARTPHRKRLLDALASAGILEVTHSAGPDELTISGASTDSIGRVAAESSIELSELTDARDSLEDAFLTMTSTSLGAA